MQETNKLASLTLEELEAKYKTTKASLIGLSIVMAGAIITLIYLSISTKNYALIAVSGGSLLTMMPIFIQFTQLQKEIKSRK